MPFRRKILYYGLLLGLTLLAIEGMARIAYYAAYNQWYGGGGPELPADFAPNPPAAPTPEPFPERVIAGNITHPFYGYSYRSPSNTLNAMPPRQRREDTVVIALLGGSVANQVYPFFQEAINRWFAANPGSRQPLFIDLTLAGSKQPQQALLIAHSLLLGGEFDLIVNLDGFNEVDGSVKDNFELGVFPFFPRLWADRVGQTGAEGLLTGNIAVLRREQARLTAIRETSPLRWSALFGLTNRYRRESAAAQISQLNHALLTAEVDYNLERHGPRSRWRTSAAALAAAARFWHRGALMMRELAALAGADYYHFLQPNQYVPDSKPLSAREREFAYTPGGSEKAAVEQGYPLLQEISRDLPGRGVNYFDLTGIFAGHTETLYRDTCCHVNDAGNELLAAAMARRMEPALLHLSGESPDNRVSALNAARRAAAAPAAPPVPPAAPGFQVSLPPDGKWLRYVRADCLPADTDPWFFLHFIPRNAADLPPLSQDQGFDNRDFVFWEEQFIRWRGRECAVSVRLPDYPIAALRTGQHIPGQGPLWQVELTIPAAPGQLRADYAALAAVNPVAQDYFDLYAIDNRLLYLRETCAAADTANPFFLHIVPAQATDLPEDSREAGFIHSGFAFARYGGPFDGKCLAAVPLPNYPIKEMRTGQHIPGQADPLWSARLIAAPDFDQLRETYAAVSAVRPAVRNYFDLYWQDNRLLYLRETCTAADTAANFFLHIIPENVADLPADRRDAGFAQSGFDFARHGGHFDGKCLAAIPLPNYPIKEMRTGQHIPRQGDLWTLKLIAAPDFDQLRADYAALSPTEPAARNYFALYLRDKRLLYLRETCAAADTAANFFLHIVPENAADLPAERQDVSFVHGGFEFVRQGGHFDGKCLAAVPLPNYPIKEMRTGQYVPGQGDLWSVTIAGP